MIIGIGTDIVEINRISNVITRTPIFLEKAFTKNEIEYINSKKNKTESIAGMFAAKEATSKAIGTGFRKFGLKDIEIIHDEFGKPTIKLSTKAIKQLFVDNYRICVSISHSSQNAIAYVVIEGRE